MGLRVLTQNVTGMRNEICNKTGPKKSILKKLTPADTDFLILTETKVTPQKAEISRMKWGLLPMLYTTQNAPKAGVIVYANKDFKLIMESRRESSQKGHFVLGLFTKSMQKLIVAGIYGITENNDKVSCELYKELNQKIEEISTLYDTHEILIAGDFNAVLAPEDANSEHIQKLRTSDYLRVLMEKYNLIDAGTETGITSHTWIRKNLNHSSRIDMIWTNINFSKIEYTVTRTIFDHACLEAKIIENRSKHKAPIRTSDYVMASEEYLIKLQEKMQDLESQLGVKITADTVDDNASLGGENGVEPSHLRGPGEAGWRGHWILEQIIKEAKKLHDSLWFEVRKKERNEIQDINEKLNYLYRKSRNKNEREKEKIKLEYAELQESLKARIEAKDKAKQNTIENFVWNHLGKCEPITYQCIKDKQRKRNISYLRTEGTNQIETREQAEIIQIMQEWYENTASKEVPQKQTVKDYLQKYNVELNKISEDDAIKMEERVTMSELECALQDAKENTAPGPSGQTINFYKLIKLHAPHVLLEAVNDMIFSPEIFQLEHNKWIKNRKVVYVQKKKDNPQTPSDYRPLSMLETLYKIPSRILAKRINEYTSNIIGKHQHGFIAGKGIQEPILLATHAIQDANTNKKPLQIVSLDMEKAFDKIISEVVTQTMAEMGFPKKIISAIEQLPLRGTAKVEINGQLGRTIIIKIGSGQGDPLSAIIFIIGIEPLNRVLAKLMENHFYETTEKIKIGPVIYADDNLCTYNFTDGDQVKEMLKIYTEYTGVSGLNINFKKSYIMCLNTTRELKEEINEMGLETPEKIKYLGVTICKNEKDTAVKTIESLDAKMIKRRIMATTPPTDMLHRAFLINTAYLPVYNHVFMSLPINEEEQRKINKEVSTFLWTRQHQGQTVKKRKLVANKRIEATFEMGGLQIPKIENMIAGLQTNLIQKLYKKVKNGEKNTLTDIIEKILIRRRCPDVVTLVEKSGPAIWKKTAEKTKKSLTYFSQACHAMARLIEIEELGDETWGQQAIYGHSKDNIFEINNNEAMVLFQKNIIMVEQLFQIDNMHVLTREFSTQVDNDIDDYPQIKTKLKNLHLKLKHLVNQHQKRFGTMRIQKHMQSKYNLSKIYKQIIRDTLSKEIKYPPALKTRQNEGIAVVGKKEFIMAYKIVRNTMISSKTKEIAFQILNRTLWTNNKAFKSGIAEDNKCPRCNQTETIEHLVANCDNYSYKIWEQLGIIITEYVRKQITETSQITVDYKTIFYNKESADIQRKIKDKQKMKILELLVQEVKRDIYRKRNKCSDIKKEEVHEIRRWAHLNQNVKKVKQYLQYLSEAKWKNSIGMLIEFETIIETKLYQ